VSIDLAPKIKEGRAIYVLIPLLVLNLALLSLQIDDPKGTLLFKKWMLTAEEPFIQVWSGVTGGIKSFWLSYIWLHGARRENEQLHAAVLDLQLQIQAMRQAQAENSRLHQLMGFSPDIAMQSVGARVVGRTPNYLSNTIFIDRGKDAGITNNDPVISAAGVVGRVVLVSYRNAQVQLITNADASTGVMVEPTRSPGVLKGSGEPWLNLDYISNSEQIHIGDVVISSGLDGIYPKGLPVGKIIDSQKGNSVFKNITVQPAADLLHLEEVLVLSKSVRTVTDSRAEAEPK
jgi:rod shape-determining protein MreC